MDSNNKNFEIPSLDFSIYQENEHSQIEINNYNYYSEYPQTLLSQEDKLSEIKKINPKKKDILPKINSNLLEDNTQRNMIIIYRRAKIKIKNEYCQNPEKPNELFIINNKKIAIENTNCNKIKIKNISKKQIGLKKQLKAQKKKYKKKNLNSSDIILSDESNSIQNN